MTKVSVIFGTRPEAIKMAILIKTLESKKEINLDVCFTGQHKEMVFPLLDFFGLTVNHSLDIMEPNQTLASLTSKSIDAMDKYLQEAQPDIVLVQGDTTTAMCAATVAFYRKIKIGHIEAGLRTHDMFSPFPEEFNRQIISRIANLHFAPTLKAKNNLLNENIAETSVFVTGNTVIDALMFTQQKIRENKLLFVQKNPWDDSGKPYILITSHRRENFGVSLENICEAIKELSAKYSFFNFVFPVHLNPNVLNPVNKILGGIKNIFLIPPLDYVKFTSLLAGSHLVLTDSGGIQEEAPSMGIPVLVMRDTSERQEAISSGSAILVGTDKRNIVSVTSNLIEDHLFYDRMSSATNPFGNGNAAEQIVEVIIENFS